MNTFATWAEKALASFLGVSKEFLTALLPVIKTSAANGLAIALPIAEQIVISLATDKTTTGAQKRDLAVTQIKTALQAQGVTLATNIINTSVELAVIKLTTPTKGVVTTPTVSA